MIHLLNTDQFRPLNRMNLIKTLLGLARVFVPLALTVFILEKLKGETLFWVLLPVGWLIVASRQHAMALLTHDAVHRSVFQSRVFNDFVGRWVFAYPVFISFSRYRTIHMDHHRALYTKGDPDAAIYAHYPIPGNKFLRILLRDFFAQSVLKNLAYFLELPGILKSSRKVELKVSPHKSDMAGFWIFHVILIGTLAWTGHLVDYFLIWIFPYVTVLQVLLRVRGALEHGAIRDPSDPLQNTRTVLSNPVVLAWIAPLGLNFHLEHHLYPTIPWYNLKAVHLLLAESSLGSKAQFTHGYWAGIKELQK